jgi:hypothetical protein
MFDAKADSISVSSNSRSVVQRNIGWRRRETINRNTISNAFESLAGATAMRRGSQTVGVDGIDPERASGGGIAIVAETEFA